MKPFPILKVIPPADDGDVDEQYAFNNPSNCDHYFPSLYHLLASKVFPRPSLRYHVQITIYVEEMEVAKSAHCIDGI